MLDETLVNGIAIKKIRRYFQKNGESTEITIKFQISLDHTYVSSEISTIKIYR